MFKTKKNVGLRYITLFLLLIGFLIAPFSLPKTTKAFMEDNKEAIESNSSSNSASVELAELVNWDENRDVPIKVVRYGDYLFAGAHRTYYPSFDIYNLSDLTNPSFVKTVNVTVNSDLSVLDDFEIIGDYLVTAGYKLESAIYQITESLDLVKKENISRSFFDQLEKYGDYIIGAGMYHNGLTYEEGMIAINFTNPNVITFETIISGSYYDFILHNNYLYLPESYNLGVKIYDLTSLDNPTLLGQTNTTEHCSYQFGSSNDEITVMQAHPFMNGTEGLYVFNTTDPNNPSWLNNYSYSISGFPLEPKDLLVEESVMFIADYQLGFQVFNITNSSSFELLSTLVCPLAREFRLEDNLLYLINDAFEIRIYNVSTRAAPALLSIIDLGGSAIKPFINQDYGYIANGFGGFYILNLSDNGKIIYHYDQLGENIRDIWVNEQLIICSLATGYLKIFSNVIKNNPILLSEHYIEDETPWDLQVYENYLFAINNKNNLSIVDISNPNNPLTTATLSINPSNVRQITCFTLKDNYVYVAESATKSIVVVDCTDKFAPEILARNDIDTVVFDIVIRENYAYLTSLYGGELLVLDISDINDFTEHYSVTHSEIPFYLFLSNENILYLTSYNNLSIFDCRNPGSAILINSYSGFWGRTYEANNYFLATKGSEGFSLYAVTKTLPRIVVNIGLPFYSFLIVLIVASSATIIYHKKKKAPKK